jgi:ABC-type cobalamin/Fe3+-siderophores transport system ATPase subunit
MGMEKFAASAGKATWDNYKAPFFKWLERKAKEGAKRYSLVGKLRDAWMKVDWGYAAQEYLKYIYEFHSQFHVFGMGEQKLDELSTNVFLHDKPEFRRYDTTERAEKITGLKIVFQDKRGEKLFVWGEPGAGKTTFLKQISTYAIEKTVYIPLFVNLAEWVASDAITYDGLLEHLAKQFERCGFEDSIIFVEYIIEEGNGILLLDGLDEISPERRNILLTILEQCRDSKSKFIVTCRVGAIQTHVTGYWEVQVAGWDYWRINDFIKRRFPEKNLQRKFIEELNTAERRSLQGLTKNPLLLSLICSFYNPEKGFPANRGEIYFEATRHLLQERDQDKRIDREPILAELTLAQKEAFYANLAFVSFSKEQLYFTQQELEQDISRILRSIFEEENPKNTDSGLILPKLISQHGILSRRSHRTYAFSHLTFQEYYTARYIADNVNRGLLKNLSTQVNDSRWREVFLLTASLLPEATPMFIAMQKAIQANLANSPGLLVAQNWAIQQAAHIPAYKNNAKRVLYWHLSLILAFFHTANTVQDLARIIVMTLVREIKLVTKLDYELDKDCNVWIIGELVYAVSNVFSSSPNLFFFDRVLGFIKYDIDYPIYKQNLQANEKFDKLLFDINTIKIVMITQIFAIIPHEERTKKRVEIFQTFYSFWEQMPANLLDTNRVIPCPDYQASNQEWQSFGNTIQKIAEYILGVEIYSSWSSVEYETALIYLQNNQLFLDCMQVSKTENFERVKSMIMRAPED